MPDQRPSRAFPAKYVGECHGVVCAGADREIEVGDMIRLHHGLAYHDDPECLPALSAWGERRGGTYDGPDEAADPWA